MKRIAIVIPLIVLLTSACGAAAPAMQRSFDSMEPGAAPESMVFEAPAEDFAPEPSGADESNVSSYGTEAAAVERLVIQNADLAIVVANPGEKLEEISKMANRMGGFVVSSNIYQTFTSNNLRVPEGNITIRVPAEKLDEALDEIKSDAVEVQNETRTGQDVTREYVDLQSRLQTHEQAAEQLSEILDQKTESEEVLEVFNQLVYHREQIELIKGQMQYFEEAAALSAVSVSIIAEETLAPLEIAGWKPVGVARDALQALINFFQGFVNFLIWLIILIIPAGLLILGLLWLLWRFFRFLWRKLFAGRVKRSKEKKQSK